MAMFSLCFENSQLYSVQQIAFQTKLSLMKCAIVCVWSVQWSHSRMEIEN